MDRAKKVQHYETIAKIIKMFSKTPSSVKEISAALYQADMERQILQDKRMKQNRRQTGLPLSLGDRQRKLDFRR